MITPEADNPWESRWTLKPVGLHQFRVVPSAGYQGSGPTGDLLTFEVDAQGKAKRVGTAEFLLGAEVVELANSKRSIEPLEIL